MNKITIIGTGSVGSTIAYSIAMMGMASEIVMIDINSEKALGEALDIRQGTPFCAPCSIYAGDYPDAAGSNIVVLTSGVARKPGQSRLELAQINVNITKTIIPSIPTDAPDATYVILADPVDILTYTFHKFSGLPENQIIGSGTILDTARLRARLSEYYNISQSNVHAYVFGEHGDSSFIPWSVANISNVPIAECQKIFAGHEISNPVLNFKEIEDYVRKSVLSGIDTTMTVSTMMHGEYGIENVCLSTLNLVGRNGVRNKVNIPLTDEEIVKLRHSADTLKEVIAGVQI